MTNFGLEEYQLGTFRRPYGRCSRITAPNGQDRLTPSDKQLYERRTQMWTATVYPAAETNSTGLWCHHQTVIAVQLNKILRVKLPICLSTDTILHRTPVDFYRPKYWRNRFPDALAGIFRSPLTNDKGSLMNFSEDSWRVNNQEALCQ
jgi:hypothetical protein